MAILLFLSMMGIAWALSAWSTMITVGMIHHEILPAVIPISYTTSLKFAGVMVLFATMGGAIKGVFGANEK